MSNLAKIKDGQVVVSSRDIAVNFEKNHRDVLSSIDDLKEGVAEKFAYLFIESEYQHEQNRQRYREYLMTRDGFTLLAMGFNGQKALEWKLKYIEAFNKMERQITSQMDISNLSPELQLMNSLVQAMNKQAMEQKKLEGVIQETKNDIQGIRDVVEIKPFDNWRDTTNKLINKMAFEKKNYEEMKKEIYKALDSRAGTKINTRLENMKTRALAAGMSRSRVEALTYLAVIGEDKKLIEIYTAIVKEMAIKKGVTVNAG